MKVKLYVEGLNAWKSRRWITSKKSLICFLNILAENPFIIIGSENDNSRKRCKLFI